MDSMSTKRRVGAGVASAGLVVVLFSTGDARSADVDPCDVLPEKQSVLDGWDRTPSPPQPTQCNTNCVNGGSPPVAAPPAQVFGNGFQYTNEFHSHCESVGPLSKPCTQPTVCPGGQTRFERTGFWSCQGPDTLKARYKTTYPRADCKAAAAAARQAAQSAGQQAGNRAAQTARAGVQGAGNAVQGVGGAIKNGMESVALPTIRVDSLKTYATVAPSHKSFTDTVLSAQDSAHRKVGNAVYDAQPRCMTGGASGDNVLIVRGVNVGLATKVTVEGANGFRVKDQDVNVHRGAMSRSYEECLFPGCLAIDLYLGRGLPKQDLTVRLQGPQNTATATLHAEPGPPYVPVANYDTCVQALVPSAGGGKSGSSQPPPGTPQRTASMTVLLQKGCTDALTSTPPSVLSNNVPFTITEPGGHDVYANVMRDCAAVQSGHWTIKSLDGKPSVTVSFDLHPEVNTNGGFFHLDQGRWTLEEADFPEGFAFYVHVL